MVLAMSSHSDGSTLRERDGDDMFLPLQTTLALNRRERPPPMHFFDRGEDESRVPLRDGGLRHRESTGGLRGIFTRNKPVKKVTASGLEQNVLLSPSSEWPTIEVHLSRSQASLAPSAPPPIPTCQQPARKPSLLNLRSKSAKPSKQVTKHTSPKSNPKSIPRPPTRTSAAWDPPPLFQAYPQAIKHAQLTASTLSADSILRSSNEKNKNSLKDDLAQTRPSSEGEQQPSGAAKLEKSKAKHRRQSSSSTLKTDWTQKIFVLVTSGYLLQYSGDGSFDRLPEKMMQLGKDSAVFASDAIPGKHWVLHISQAMDTDGTPTADSRSFLSRLAFRSADYKRAATSMLMILNNAEDMESWLAVVRREIEALGGKKQVSETGKPKLDDKVMQLRARPSHRYLVQRDPDQLPNMSPPQRSRSKEDRYQDRLEDEPFSLFTKRSSYVGHTTRYESRSNSVASNDGHQLENLRDSSIRLSNISSGERTLITSQGSTPPSSPRRESTSTFDDYPFKVSIEDVRPKPKPNSSTINERRGSTQPVQMQMHETQSPLKSFRPQSTFGSLPINTSQPPNFSVPRSSSIRHSMVKNSVTDTPPIRSICTAAPSRPRETMLKGTRKAPPTALALVRPLSPVQDSPLPSVSRAVETTPVTGQQTQQTTIDVPRRHSEEEAPPAQNVQHPRRMSSLIPVNAQQIAFAELSSCRRYSTVNTICRETETRLEHPLRSASVPPIPRTELLPIPSLVPQNKPGEIKTRADKEKESLPPLPILANTKSKLRRPTSMQIRPSANPPFKFPETPPVSEKSANSSPIISPEIYPANHGRPCAATPTSASSSTFDRGLKSPAPPSGFVHGQRLQPNALYSRKSMPALINGPPPAPPPNCALPPIPGSTKLSPIGIRKSVKV